MPEQFKYIEFRKNSHIESTVIARFNVTGLTRKELSNEWDDKVHELNSIYSALVEYKEDKECFNNVKP